MPNANQLLHNATTHHRAGRLADAEHAYRKLLRAEAANSDALRLLGGLYLQTGQHAKAVEQLEKAARLIPGDAETMTNLGLALRGAGRIDDAVARYRQVLQAQPDYMPAFNNLSRIYHESGRTLEALELHAQALRLHPDNPVAHYNYGNGLLNAGKVSEAIARYEHALQLKPDYLEAMINLGMALGQIGQGDRAQSWLRQAQGWFEKVLLTDAANTVAMNNLGNVLRQQDRAADAEAWYRKALDLRPDYAEAALNLATALRDLGRLEEAIEFCGQALRLRPSSSDAHINFGTLLQEVMRHQDAVAAFDAALALKPQSIDAKWNKALSLMALGDYAQGLPLHEIGLGVGHMRGDYPSPERRWNGEDLSGKRLLLWCEQGLGDSLQFVRYAEMCKQRGGKIILLCPRPLRSLFRNCPFIDELPEAVEEHDFDLHAPLMSMPLIFATRLETIPVSIPYLHIGAEARARWAVKFTGGTGFKVGLVWAGNPREKQIAAHMIDRRRSMALEQWRPLFDVPGAAFYNLQMGDAAAQIDACGLRDRFVDLMPDVKNFEDTGAIIERLDLVIAVDTSVVHLAGGLGKPVWVLSRFDACWRWLHNRPDSPWYPTARVFGQPRPGDWGSVIAAVKNELALKASSSAPR